MGEIFVIGWSNETFLIRIDRRDIEIAGKGEICERIYQWKKKKGSPELSELRGIKSLLILMVGEVRCSLSLKFQVTRLTDTRFARDYSRPCN